MDDNFLDDVAADVAASTSAIPAAEKLGILANLCQKYRDAEDEISALEEKLSAAKKALVVISEIQIPEIFNELGLKEFKLSNGLRVSVNPFFSGKITSDEGYEWLEENGFGDIVKYDFTVSIKRNDAELLEDVKKLVGEIGLDYKEKYGVHPMTFSAFLKEQITGGHELPRELLGVYTGFKTKIK